jgi:hypothetical protein
MNIFHRQAWMNTDCTWNDPGQYADSHSKTTDIDATKKDLVHLWSSAYVCERPWIDRVRQRPYAPWSHRHGPGTFRGCTGKYHVHPYRNRHCPCRHCEKIMLTSALKIKDGRITPDDENFASVIDRHLVRECVKGEWRLVSCLCHSEWMQLYHVY